MNPVRTVSLAEVCRQDRVSVRTGEMGHLRYIGMESIEAGTGQLSVEQQSKTPEAPAANSFRFETEHVLYGKLRPYLNKVYAPDFEGKCSTELIPLRPTYRLDRHYLAYFLRTPGTVEAISQRAAGARMPRADMEFVLALQIPLPEIEQQRNFVSLLSRAEGILRMRREAEQKAKQIIPALFLDMFGDPATNPSGWITQRLSSVCAVSYGISTKLDSSVTAETGRRILTISNVLVDGQIDLSIERYSQATDKKAASAEVKSGDLLFNWRNGSETHIGKTAIWERPESVLHVSFLLRLRPDQRKVTSLYVWSLLNRLRSTGFFLSASRQQVNRKFNASELSALRVPIAPFELQERFSSNAMELRRHAISQGGATIVAEQVFQSMLAEVFGEGTA